ncbi:hypothetical protein Y032_0006g3047 [Ancylostoma ceylanicum]|uniref:Uncharacterized protein n=1 Tax=Ancylostoma ceylanicum TaxID=53326 RepID=A0A016VRD7_9BILA|nr:hypothetical protein Y032_0006g3047 [Ancylostoma ceylanicum]
MGARILKKTKLIVPDLPDEVTTESSEKTDNSSTTGVPETGKPIVPEESKCQENEVFVECSKKCEQHCHLPIWVGL